ncbi:MAG: 4-hydroxythreonine-4-phosphate dehydrogenase PdxA [Gammaproteobacteria bacterium]|jgi:4-phospho-D-threonate 3-dehydrogenase / 4-phospho-D-erythronate 3-dehydrogenase|nr:4-hydroxythreonine-4-phosphate dehydrogenase PdxA [Gammaproteobacteria bacterium]
MKPLAITLGDPAGIGPEIAMKTLEARQTDEPWLFVGPRWALSTGAEAAGIPEPDLPCVSEPASLHSGVGLLEIDLPKPRGFEFGQVQAECGRVAVMSVERAALACLHQEVDAMVTCPLNKEAIHAAGFVGDIGHQEILARLTGTDSTATLLMTPGLRVAHLSTHKSLIEAARYVKQDTVLEKLHLIHKTFSKWGVPYPRIAVAALNPHGGEGGMLGREEIEELIPAVSAAQTAGLRVVGPIPADSVFNRAVAGEFDVVLALYHDQGHIAIKVHNFHASTTATMGIPFVRTSVDHGTAFDIAGRGQANPQGLIAAIASARNMVAGKLL